MLPFLSTLLVVRFESKPALTIEEDLAYRLTAAAEPLQGVGCSPVSGGLDAQEQWMVPVVWEWLNEMLMV